MLEHRAWKKHKYVARVEADYGYRYFYSNEDYLNYMSSLSDEEKLSDEYLRLLDSRIDVSGRGSVLKLTIRNMREMSANAKNDTKVQEFMDSVGDMPYPRLLEQVTAEREHKYIARIPTDYGYRYFYTQDELDAYNARRQYQENEPDFMKDLDELDEPSDFMEDGMAVNPNFGVSAFSPDPFASLAYTMNCYNCTTAYELRRRGYDVEAGPATIEHQRINRIEDYWENPVINQINPTESSTADSIRANNPPGSRGNLCVYWNQGGGHSMAYEVRNDGTVVVIDAQMGVYYSTDDSDTGERRAGNVSMLDTSYTEGYIFRTDNLTPREEILDALQ